jgi:Flp pilus assembly pilin Flp
MKQFLGRIGKGLGALHRDEQGADMVEYILIVAAIALPLLGFVVYFWGDIKTWALGLFEQIKGDATNQMQP